MTPVTPVTARRHPDWRRQPVRADCRAVRHRERSARDRSGRRASPTSRGATRVPFIFKASYDKANRTSGRSFRGPGLDEGLRVLARDQGAVRRADPDRHPRAGAGARRPPTSPTCCRFRRSSAGRPICSSPRRGPAASSTSRRDSSSRPTTCKHAVAKVVDAGNPRVIVTERGTSFGYHNLVVDMRAFPMMREQGVPVVFDVTHSLQLPGGGDGVTAGLARVHRAAGVGRRRGRRRRRLPRSPRGAGAREERRAERAAPRPARAAAPPADGDRRDRQARDAAPGRRRPPWLIARSRARCSKPKRRRSSRWSPRLDERFDRAVELLQHCRGRVILTGMGKSGIICRKIAATLTSTGTPAFFLHPAEAIHGDLGVIQGDDVVVALSYSGETDETAAAARNDPPARREADRDHRRPGVDAGAGGRRRARLQRHRRSVPDEPGADREHDRGAGHRRRAGDDAARRERASGRRTSRTCIPGGKLGKRLMRVEALMHAGEQCPIVRADTRMRDVIYEMSQQGPRHDLRRRRRRRAARHHHRRRPAPAHGARAPTSSS